MKKILFLLGILYLNSSFAQNFKYQLLGPCQIFGKYKYSEFYSKTNVEDFKKFCLQESQNQLKKYYGADANDLLTISKEITDEEILKNIIYVRINVSRMQLTYELLGKSNFQYSLRSTGGIEFFNIKTGEVYFSKIYTIIQPKQIIKEKIEPLSVSNKEEFYNLFKNNIKELFDYLFQKSKEEFKPGIIKANIVKVLNGFTKNKLGIPECRIIINKGRLNGIVEKQQLRFINSKQYPPNTKVIITEIQDNYSIGSIKSEKEFAINIGEEIYRSGGMEVSNKFPLRMMLQKSELIDNTQIDPRYNVDLGFVTQVVNDNLSDNSSFCMLPYGSISEQQFEATKGGEKEEEAIGNRQRPDIYIKCIISKAFVYSTEFEGGQYLKLVVSPILIFIDANLGSILYMTSVDEENLQMIKENERIANVDEQFEILTKNAIYEVTKKAKSEFSLIATQAIVKSADDKKLQLEMESGTLSAGMIFRVFKSGDEVIDPISKKNLGKLLTYIGNVKAQETDAKKGTAEVLFTTEKISSGDLLFSNSEKNPSKGMQILQQNENIKISNKDGSSYSQLSSKSILFANMLSLVNSKRFNLLLPKDYLQILIQEKKSIETSGQFKEGQTESSFLNPQLILNSEFLIFPPEISSENSKKLSIGQYFLLSESDQSKQIVKKGKKQELPLEGEKDKNKVSVGLSEKDFPKHYIDMCRSISLILSNAVADEIKK